MTTRLTANTVADLVAIVTNRRYMADTRWTMWDSTEWIWDNEEEANKWIAEKWNPACDAYGTPEYDNLIKEAEACRPPKHRKTTYNLQEANQNHSRSYVSKDTISLSMELGDMIDAVWTKKQARYGNYQERTGCLTIPGMLKRLGNTTVKAEIQAAEELARANEARNRRNNARHELKRLAVEARKQLDILGLPADLTIQDLLAIQDEQ